MPDKVNATFYDTSVYRGRYVTQCNQVVPDTFLRLTTGFDDVTITVTWAPVNADSSEAIAARQDRRQGRSGRRAGQVQAQQRELHQYQDRP